MTDDTIREDFYMFPSGEISSKEFLQGFLDTLLPWLNGHTCVMVFTGEDGPFLKEYLEDNQLSRKHFMVAWHEAGIFRAEDLTADFFRHAYVRTSPLFFLRTDRTEEDIQECLHKAFFLERNEHHFDQWDFGVLRQYFGDFILTVFGAYNYLVKAKEPA